MLKRIGRLFSGSARGEAGLAAIGRKLDSLSVDVERLAQRLELLGAEAAETRMKAARVNPAAALGFNGPNENQLYAGFFGETQPLAEAPAPIPLTSSLCRQAHFGFDQYRYWMRAMKIPPMLHRKYWEYFFIVQALFERGLLAPGKRGLGFGVGWFEPLTALFASFGVRVLASDQSVENATPSGWVNPDPSARGEWGIAALNRIGLCTDHMFRELASFEVIDMNEIPARHDGQFDFCWSSCSFEHLGSLRHGMEFVKNSVKALKPGGFAVHTTEYNLSSNDDTVEEPGLSIYRRRDIELLFAELESEGHRPSPVDFRPGDGFADAVVDLPPYGRGEPHLRLRINAFDCTSIGLIVQKALG